MRWVLISSHFIGGGIRGSEGFSNLLKVKVLSVIVRECQRQDSNPKSLARRSVLLASLLYGFRINQNYSRIERILSDFLKTF